MPAVDCATSARVLLSTGFGASGVATGGAAGASSRAEPAILVSNFFGSTGIFFSPGSTVSRRSGNFTAESIFAISVPSAGLAGGNGAAGGGTGAGVATGLGAGGGSTTAGGGGGATGAGAGLTGAVGGTAGFGAGADCTIGGAGGAAGAGVGLGAGAGTP